jgi:signal transduction histidine kinase
MTDEARFAELISAAGHELRSPLTSIKGFSSTLVKRWDRFTDEQRLQFIETIHTDSERMSRIVSEVLDLARAEAGRLELQLGPVDLSVSTKVVLERLEDRAGIERVEVDIPEGLSAWTDRDRFERSLENLVENAIKFSDEGPVRVDAYEEGDFILVKLADSGEGIAPERLANIFSGPGPRGQKAPTAMGLGLLLTQRTLRAQVASISVDSQLGAGTTFTMKLPAKGEAG